MSKHTEGPWEVSRGAQADAFAIESATRTVAHVKTLPEATANARLIAAAPEMLEALRGVSEWIELITQELPEIAGDFAPVRTAIAKAEGRES